MPLDMFQLPLFVELDLQIQRRRRVHAILDANGDPVYHAVRISEILTWLIDAGVSQITMVDENARFDVTFQSSASADAT